MEFTLFFYALRRMVHNLDPVSVDMQCQNYLNFVALGTKFSTCFSFENKTNIDVTNLY